MTFKQLEAFYWAASCQSYAVAAARLNISVSSLSKRISEFEGFLNVSLFDRSARSVTLSPVGEQLLPHARSLLQNADNFLMQVQTSLTLAGRCRFGVGELGALTWLPTLMAKIQSLHPGLSVEPVVGIGEQLEKGLEEGELDFAIVSGTSTRTSIVSDIFSYATFDWVASSAFENTDIAPVDLVNHTLITPPKGAGTVRLLDQWLVTNEIAIGRHLQFQSIGAIANLISQNIGIGFLPSAWAESLIQRGVLVRLIQFPKMSPLPYGFHWRRDDSRPLIDTLRTLSRECFEICAPKMLV